MDKNLLFSLHVETSLFSLARDEVFLLVDVSPFLTPSGTVKAVFFVDSNVLFNAAAGVRCGGRRRSVASFVTFPSDARSGKVDLLVYLDVRRLLNRITPIRGREDCMVLMLAMGYCYHEPFTLNDRFVNYH